MAEHTDIVFAAPPTERARYVTGRIIYDEALCDGHLVGRYWSPCGQIWPEMHLPPARLEAALRQGPLDAFRLAIEGELLLDGWNWVGGAEQADESGLRNAGAAARQAVVTLRHTRRPIEVRVCTRLDGSDWLVRWLEITNLGQQATAISAVAPMAGRLWAHRYDEHLTESEASPFALAYNHQITWGHEGDLWYEPVRPGTITFDGGRNGKSGWSRPTFWARDLANGQTFVAEMAWSGNWQFEINCRLDENSREGALYFALGLAPAPAEPSGTKQEMLRVLAPGERVRTPAVHMGFFQCDVDRIVQSLHRHVRHTVMPQAPAGHDIEIEANHRGYLCDRENELNLKRDVDVAASIGAEMYVIDAGWFGREPNQWGRNVGDWHAGPWLPNGLEPVVEYAHAKGMRFGLWVEAEAAGENSALREEHPEWLVKRHGQLVANGRALDLSKPEVAAWVEGEIERLIRQYKLDMFRLDHNHGMGQGGTREHQGFIENTLWLYYEALYGIFDHLRVRFPSVVFQNCAGGGGRLDLGILQRFHSTELSDWMRQPRAMALFNGLTMALPPEIGLRTFGTETGEHVLDADVDTQLRYALLCRPIFRGIAPSMEELSAWLRERILYHLDLYKRFLRPLLRDCLVYHHTPWLPVNKPTLWCVLEYGSPNRERAVVALFRLCAGEQTTYHVFPKGLDRGQRYRVHSANSGQVMEIAGWDAINAGLRVELDNAFSSELLLFEQVAPLAD
jgi:alpha-galactosidase